jgi:hypothetical protein
MYFRKTINGPAAVRMRKGVDDAWLPAERARRWRAWTYRIAVRTPMQQPGEGRADHGADKND